MSDPFTDSRWDFQPVYLVALRARRTLFTVDISFWVNNLLQCHYLLKECKIRSLRRASIVLSGH